MVLYFLTSRNLSYFVVTALCLICYWNSLHCQLVHDDVFAIVNNNDLRQDTPLTTVFQNDFWGKSMKDNTSHKSYRPVCILTFRLNYYIHKLEPLGYHLVNVLLHLTVSLFFLYFCEANIFRDVRRSTIAGILFTVHPVHTEAVTGVVGRADVLACLFFLISLHLYEIVRNEDCAKINNNNYKDSIKQGKSICILLASVLFGGLSMLCKETGITVFGVCISLELIQRKNYIIRSFFKRSKNVAHENLGGFRKRVVIIVFAVAALLAFRIHMLNGKLPAFNEEDNPASFSPSLLTRFFTYSYLCAFNAWLLISPVVLSYDWQIGSIPLVESFIDVRIVFSLLFFLGLEFLAAKAFMNVASKTNDVTLIGLSLLVIPYIPASNLFFRVGFVVAERILYIPSTGYCILVANGFHLISNYFNTASVVTTEETHQNGKEVNKNERYNKCKSKQARYGCFVVEAIFTVIIAVMVVRTTSRNEVWRNRETLFRSGVETLPHNAKAHYNYANFLKDTNKTSEAIHHYKIAVELYPKHASSHNNLATLLGDSEEAEFHLRQTLLHNPYHYKAMYNLASMYRKRRENKLARALLEKCLSLRTEYNDAIQVYAEVLYDLGETEKSLNIYSQASTNTNDADFFNNYGVFLGKIGKNDESIIAYKKSIELQPIHKVALINLGHQLKLMGRFAEAEQIYRRALKISRDGNTLKMLGILLYQMKRFKEAELTFSEALKHDPKNPEYIRNYASSIFEQGLRDEAIAVLKNGLQLVPESTILTNILANFLMNLNRLKEAVEIIESGLKSHPEETELHFLRANMFREQGNMDLALESYKEVARLDPKHFGAIQNIGVIYHLKGFKIEAKSYYQQALALDPSNKVLKENIKKLMRT